MDQSLFIKFVHDATAEIVLAAMLLCWLGFALILVVGKRQAAKVETKRSAISLAGFFVQGVGYAILLVFARTFFSPFVPMPRIAEMILATVTMAIAFWSVWFCLAAARTLGKQWALVARVVENHELVMEGPYGIVRNPIYLAMFGMLIATGLAVATWQGLILGTIVFLAGNEIRIRSEEKLLRGAFGAKFEEYARRVPAFLPRLF
jgi:protein-S-isoprenylcysteine O-methyltransferase Ste14